MLHVRSHVDVTDPSLTALDALIEVATRVKRRRQPAARRVSAGRDLSFPGGDKLLVEAARRGVDVIGAIPHFEDTREDGVRSLEIAVDTRVDGTGCWSTCIATRSTTSSRGSSRCSRRMRCAPGCGRRATASHTTAMGGYNAAYSPSCSGSWLGPASTWSATRWSTCTCRAVSTATRSAAGSPRSRRCARPGVNVAFGHDDVMDPWFPLGTGNPLQVAHVGALAAQMTSPARDRRVLPHGD